jgi:hypothetical protein
MKLFILRDETSILYLALIANCLPIDPAARLALAPFRTARY